MRMIIIVLLCMVFTLPGCSGQGLHKEELHPLKMMSFNIRFDNPEDGENVWEKRLPLVIDYMEEEYPDMVGMQEALYNQITDITSGLPGYSFVGTGRDDGKKGGEHCPIFFRKDKLTLIEHSQFWLSETPDIPGSIGWEAVLPRIVTWAKFEYSGTGYNFFVFNTHLSHVSSLAKWKSVGLISEKITEIAGNNPVILTGDFNITKGSDLYHNMISWFKSNNLLYNAELVSLKPVENAESTLNGFSDNIQPRVIDYIFAGKDFDVLEYKVNKVKKEGVFISDHWPVVSIINALE